MSFHVHFTIHFGTLQPRQRQACSRDATASVPAKLCNRTARSASRHAVAQHATVSAATSQEVEPGKHISGTPIPAFIPREVCPWPIQQVSCTYQEPAKLTPSLQGSRLRPA